jgi:uncharacterized protein (TIGR03083 family)
VFSRFLSAVSDSLDGMGSEKSKRDRDVYFARLRGRLDDEFRLLRAAIAGADPWAAVPACPDWNADQLAHHVAGTYLYVVECVRQGRLPEDRPRPELNPNPVGALDEGYRALTEALDEGRPGDPAGTWHEPDQTAGFWIRRMCQESVVHRVDAEQVAGIELAPIPPDVALDGIDEFLTLFIGYLSRTRRERFAEVLEGADPRPVTIAAGGREWTLTAGPEGVAVAAEPGADGEAAWISGDPDDVLLWLWGRVDDRAVRQKGEEAPLAQFRELRAKATR